MTLRLYSVPWELIRIDALASPPQKIQDLWGRVQHTYFNQLPIVLLCDSKRCCISRSYT